MYFRIAATFLFWSTCNFAQAEVLSFSGRSKEVRTVTGGCRVNLGPYIQKREVCEILTPEQTVPEGTRLVIEHVSAACTSTMGRPIHTLALITRTAANVRSIPTHVPVGIQASMTNLFRYVGGQATRIYAGEGTNVEVLAGTWESAGFGETTCQVTFNGVLETLPR